MSVGPAMTLICGGGGLENIVKGRGGSGGTGGGGGASAGGGTGGLAFAAHVWTASVSDQMPGGLSNPASGSALEVEGGTSSLGSGVVCLSSRCLLVLCLRLRLRRCLRRLCVSLPRFMS
jgi:hypothetical protein